MNIAGDKQIEVITGKELELCRKACEVCFTKYIYIFIYTYIFRLIIVIILLLS